MSFDQKCHDLAEHFLSDEKDVTPEAVEELAQTIQTAIEDWLEARDDDRLFPKDAPR